MKLTPTSHDLNPPTGWEFSIVEQRWVTTLSNGNALVVEDKEVPQELTRAGLRHFLAEYQRAAEGKLKVKGVIDKTQIKRNRRAAHVNRMWRRRGRRVA